MTRKLGTLFIILGIGMVLSSLALYANNQIEGAHAGFQSAQVILRMEEKAKETVKTEYEESLPAIEIPDPYDPEMTELEIDGHKYIGYLQLPCLEEPLPVMSDWTYAKLRIAPCRYFGSSKTDNLVIMAHNYPKHFGKLKDIALGENLYFVDMDGISISYRVVAREILGPNDVLSMTDGDYDLSLFTCTYGGASRLVLRCDRAV